MARVLTSLSTGSSWGFQQELLAGNDHTVLGATGHEDHQNNALLVIRVCKGLLSFLIHEVFSLKENSSSEPEGGPPLEGPDSPLH